MKKELGKTLIDIAKLVFAGVILAALMKQDISPAVLFISGGIATVLMIFAGLILIRIDEKENKKKLWS